MTDWLCGLFGFALLVAYWPGIAGAATTSRWDVAALLAIALWFVPRIRLTLSHGLGLALIAWLMLSLSWNDGGQDGLYDGIDAASQLVIASVAFAIGSLLMDMKPLLFGCALGIGVNSVVAIAQYFGQQIGIETYGATYPGLFFNPDRLAAAAALVAIGSVALRRWYWLPLSLPSLFLVPSRAAWLAVLAGLLVMRPRSKVVMWGMRLAALACVVIGIVSGGLSSGHERLLMWQDTISSLTFFGHGLGSFREDFLRFAHAYDLSFWQSRPEHPHNELLSYAFEGGAPAVALGVLLAITLWRAAKAQPARGILAGLFVLSLFAMPFHDPATLVLGAIVAGYCAGCGARQRDAAYPRGFTLRDGLAAALTGSGID